MGTSHSKSTRPVRCQIDTGSSCNTISKREYYKVVQDDNKKLKATKTQLILYDGTKLMPIGKCKLTCTVGKRTKKLEFIVVDIDQTPLLSATASEMLGLITVNFVHNVAEKEQPQHMNKYLSNMRIHVFDGLGCLPGEYKIET